MNIPLLEESSTPKDDGTVYKVYIIYGINFLLMFNTVLSSLQYFIDTLPDYRPNFILGWFINISIMATMIIISKYGHKISFIIKVNFMSLMSIVVLMALVQSQHVIQNEAIRFWTYVFFLMLIGVILAIMQSAVLA